MIFVEGGTFTLGWEDGTIQAPIVGTNPGGIPDDTKPVTGVTVSDYYLSDTVVTNALWNAVMGLAPPSASTRNNAKTNADYYEVHEFYTRLYVLTGRTYYMPTEAQWEYAAKGGQPGQALGHNLLPFPSSLTQAPVEGSSGTGTGAVKQTMPNILGIYNFLTDHGEWTWNDWSNVHLGGTDPTGLRGPIHAQKTRRGGTSSTGARELHSRLIRSIDGTGLTFRIALSGDQTSVPPGMTTPKDIHAPRVNDLNTPNSHRDMRWVTPEGYVWEGLRAGVGIVSADHYLVDFGDYTGRQAGVFPMEVRSQDPRLIDGPDRGWWMGYGFGGIHTYRKDVDLNGNFRFSVYTALEGQNVTSTGSLARGPWFTVNNMFKRTQLNAAGTAFHDELYLIIPNADGKVTTNDVHFNLRDMTYMDYERGDNRRFLLRNNEDIIRHTQEQGGTTGYGGTGNTTWRMPHGDPRPCPGIPNPVGTKLECGGNILTCTCPVFQRIPIETLKINSAALVT